jgi:AraC family transcriptional regulator of arabinose operon
MYDPAFDETNRQAITPAPPPGILVANHFRASYGYHVRRPAGTRDWLLTFTVSGIGRYCVADQTHLCRADDVMILQPGTMHDYATYRPAEPWEFYWTHFLPRPHWADWLQLTRRAPGLCSATVGDAALRGRIAQAFGRMLHDLHSSSPFQSDFAANALEEILLCIAQHEARIRPHTLDPRVDAVLQQINARYREPITIAELACAVALSPSRLAHLFKAQVGRSIIETVIATRLQQSDQLLKYTTLHLGEIAHEVGFQSASYFSRQFKAHYGLSPEAYRLHHQGRVR